MHSSTLCIRSMRYASTSSSSSASGTSSTRRRFAKSATLGCKDFSVLRSTSSAQGFPRKLRRAASSSPSCSFPWTKSTTLATNTTRWWCRPPCQPLREVRTFRRKSHSRRAFPQWCIASRASRMWHRHRGQRRTAAALHHPRGQRRMAKVAAFQLQLPRLLPPPPRLLSRRQRRPPPHLRIRRRHQRMHCRNCIRRRLPKGKLRAISVSVCFFFPTGSLLQEIKSLL
mmetsp:Transcript_11458/g.25907  ORF Transcript_11458/g.25907 Transcript_11458/m.25907 type:complete len:227 (+) Transcript_11458:306-986(+)